ncbi:MAG: hypothetical protein QM817_11455 [Archangium sp.]
MILRATCIVGLLLVTGCSNAYVGMCPGPTLDQVSTEGSGDVCSARASYFKGTVPPGGSCTNFDDCAPTCCGCASGRGEALAAPGCKNGRCPTLDEVCCAFNNSDICRRGPSSKFFKTCSQNSDCAPGMECLKRYQVTSRDSQIGAVCEGAYQQNICTKRCSTDSECTAFDGACTGADRCDGPKNLCHNR